MKTKIALLALAVASFTAQATNGDNVQKQLDDLKAGLHQVHVNTLGKYSESWGLEDRANIAKLQGTKVDKSLFTADQQRQDKALADAVSKQAAKDCKQTSDLKGYADAKATSAYRTSVAHTDAEVARADADRAKGDEALQAQITRNLSNQAARDVGQDDHINAVQGAAQAANEKADGLAVRADAAEGAIRETNAQVAVTDSRSINNARRIDGVEKVNGQQDKAISSNTQRIAASEGDIKQLYANGEYAQSRIDAANANIEANRSALVASNKRIAAHTAQLADHEQRLGNLEQSTNRAFADMKGRIDRVEKSANAGASAALSAASIPQVTEYQRFAVGAGVGGYEGESALAVGFSSRLSSAVVVKASVTTDSQHGFGYGAGLSVGW